MAPVIRPGTVPHPRTRCVPMVDGSGSFSAMTHPHFKDKLAISSCKRDSNWPQNVSQEWATDYMLATSSNSLTHRWTISNARDAERNSELNLRLCWDWCAPFLNRIEYHRKAGPLDPTGLVRGPSVNGWYHGASQHVLEYCPNQHAGISEDRPIGRSSSVLSDPTSSVSSKSSRTCRIKVEVRKIGTFGSFETVQKFMEIGHQQIHTKIIRCGCFFLEVQQVGYR